MYLFCKPTQRTLYEAAGYVFVRKLGKHQIMMRRAG